MRVNQKANGERWVPLGAFDFTPGGGHKVVLSNDANEAVFADAIRFEQVAYDGNRIVAADAARFTANTAEAASVRYVHPDHLSLPRA